MIEFAKNDITYALPDDSGVRACTLALRELSRRVVELVDEASAVGCVKLEIAVMMLLLFQFLCACLE